MRWSVQEAAGGAEALGYLQETFCEALLLDSWLPDLEAGDFASQLRLQYPDLDLIRVDEMLESSGGARSSRRNELLHALRRSRELAETAQPVFFGNTGLSVNLAPRGLRSPQAHGINPVAGFLSGKATPASRPESADGGTCSGEITPAEPGLKADAATKFAVTLPGMIGDSVAMRNLAHRIQLVAGRKTTVLVEGPTGSGKELVAQALHRLSTRAGKPFVVINCAAIPEALLEAELFGHTRGAFTGAVQSRIGRIEAARGGTLFLDEIGEIPLALQSKLLRFLESGELQRIGENEPIRVDVRIVAATSAADATGDCGHLPLGPLFSTGCLPSADASTCGSSGRYPRTHRSFSRSAGRKRAGQIDGSRSDRKTRRASLARERARTRACDRTGIHPRGRSVAHYGR